MTQSTILVTGATSPIGRRVVENLRALGRAVRASARDATRLEAPAGVETVSMDLTESDSVRAAFARVDRAFVLAVPGTESGLLDAARQTGLERLVLLSSGSVLLPSCAENAITIEHRQVEENLTSTDGLRVIPVRPLVLATNSLAWAYSYRRSGQVTLYQPDALNAPIHEADLAAVIATALTADSDDPRLTSGRISGLLTGPRQLSQRDQVAAIRAALGTTIPVIAETRADALARFSRFMDPVHAEAVLGFLDDCAVGNSPATDVVLELLGRDPLDFAIWARDHRDDFR